MARFDTATFDEVLFDTEGTSSPDVPDTSTIKIGTYDLQNADILVSKFTYSGPKYDIATRGYPRADGAYVESAQFRETRLRLRGTILKSTAVLLEQEMDLMRQAFALNRTLMFTFAGERRFWDVYPVGFESIFDGKEGHDITRCPWEIELLCVHPYARSSGRESTTGTNAVAPATTYQITNGGSAQSQSIVTLTIQTAGTLSKLSWENETTGEIVTIDNGGSFTNGDTIVIDSEAKTVTKNGTAIDYLGLLPHMDAGTNSCTLTAITGSGHTIGVSERHYRRYY